MSDFVLKYRGYGITEKKDFSGKGFYRHGFYTNQGFIATDESGMVNVMPGAIWFSSITDAKRAIDVLINVSDPEGEPKEFWDTMYTLDKITKMVSKGLLTLTEEQQKQVDAFISDDYLREQVESGKMIQIDEHTFRNA